MEKLAGRQRNGQTSRATTQGFRKKKRDAGVPDFALVDSKMEGDSLRKIQRQGVLGHVIYTRCPLPGFLPR